MKKHLELAEDYLKVADECCVLGWSNPAMYEAAKLPVYMATELAIRSFIIYAETTMPDNGTLLQLATIANLVDDAELVEFLETIKDWNAPVTYATAMLRGKSSLIENAVDVCNTLVGIAEDYARTFKPVK